MQEKIGDIAEEATIVSPTAKCGELYSIFKEKSSIEGIVICTEDIPVGLVTQTQFYQKLSTKYGFDLFMNRTIDLVMNKEPLIVDGSISIAEVSSLAMHRNQDNLYDYVIVTNKNRIYGIVSIKNLLMKLAEVQIKIARYSNPLTGLPGNYVIEEKLQDVLSMNQFSVFYIDIDAFKVFNDTYGFKQGDELLRQTAAILSTNLEKYDDAFIGHIGGDDFIAIIPNHDYEPLCEAIISEFDTMVRTFYTKEDLERGYIQAMSRRGELKNFSLVSISIAVIPNINIPLPSVQHLSKKAAEIKKMCKAVPKSIYLTAQECQNPAGIC